MLGGLALLLRLLLPLPTAVDDVVSIFFFFLGVGCGSTIVESINSTAGVDGDGGNRSLS